MARLLSLDVGLTTGFAIVEGGKPPITGSVMLRGNSSTGLGPACHDLGHLLKNLIGEHKPDGLVLCTPYISKKFTDISPTKLLFGMFGIAHAVAYTANLQVYELDESRVRAAFAIKSDRSIKNREKRRKDLKNKVIQACTDRRWLVCDGHAGDAMLAAAYKLGALQQQFAIQTQPLFVAAAPKPRRRAAPRKKAA